MEANGNAMWMIRVKDRSLSSRHLYTGSKQDVKMYIE